MSDFVNIDGMTFGTDTFASADTSQIMGFFAAYGTGLLIVSILVIIELWIIFKKCGKPGWLSIIPIANFWTLFQICDLPGWLSIVPVANMIGLLVAYFKLPAKFNKSAAFGLGILFLAPIFLGILAFSKAKKEEEVSASSQMTDNVPVMNDAPAEEPMVNTTATPDLMAAPVETPNAEVNTFEADKAFTPEEPALNLGESAPEVIPAATVAPIPAPIPEPESAPEINAFEMTSPAPAEPVMPVSEPVQEPITDSLDQNIFNAPPAEEPVVPMAEPVAPTPVPEEPAIVLEEAPVPAAAEEDLELPKMVNEVVNSDITEKKICKNCNHENPYTNKICEMCGTVLE